MRSTLPVVLSFPQYNLEDDANMKQMLTVESATARLESKMTAVVTEMDGIERVGAEC